jgi:hypothetical protein
MIIEQMINIVTSGAIRKFSKELMFNAPQNKGKRMVKE